MGRVVFITGGGGPGMGNAISSRFAKAGDTVVVSDLDAGRAETVAEELVADGHHASGVGLDVKDPVACDRMIDTVIADQGGLDVLCLHADSGLSVPESKRHRFSTCYWHRSGAGEPLEPWDEPDGRFASDPVFPNSLVSTAGDYLNFSTMILGGGLFRERRVLTRESVALMTTDHLSDTQKEHSPAGSGFWQERGWGMGGSVYRSAPAGGPCAGSYSWFGGYGGHFLIDVRRGGAVVLMVPRMIQGEADAVLRDEFELNACRGVLAAGVRGAC